MSRAIINALIARRAEAKSALDQIMKAPGEEKRDLNPAEKEAFDAKEAEIRAIDERIKELDEQIARDAEAAETARKYAPKEGEDGPRIEVGAEPLTYMKGNRRSYFQDLANAQLRNNTEAAERLVRHAMEMDVEMPKREKRREEKARRELRAIDKASSFEKRVNPNRTDGQGGYFVPPLWLIDEYIDLPRFGRTFANSVKNMDLPAGTDSVNVPKIATGTATGVQTADAAAVTSQDLTDTFVTAPVRTIAGQQDVAMQLLDQSPVGFDEITFADLIADYNQKLDIQCWSGTGANGQVLGVLNVSGVNAITYTDASPSLPELYGPLMQALSQSAKNRKMMPTAVFLTPSRWFWMASQLDGQNRPFILPETQAPFNPVALQTGEGVEGPVGRVLQFPLMADGNIPANLGAGTNEERIVAARTSDMYLWEGGMRTRVLQEVLSGTLQVRFQAYNYAAFMPHRRPEQISIISGTGVIAPSGF